MKNIKYIDCHTHAQFAIYDVDRDAVIARAQEARVGMVNVGTGKTMSESAVRLAEQNEHMWATIGLHPIHAHESYIDADEHAENLTEETFDYEFYKKLALNKKTVAIGECGLDYFHLPAGEEEAAKESQKKVFIEQVRLAEEVKKPLMIHCREAYDDLLEILKKENCAVSGIIHFFCGNETQAKAFLDLGFYFTFGGVVTFTHAYDEVVKIIPLERILSETDAPYVAPVPYRGKRNEPAYVVHVVHRLAKLKGTSTDAMAEQIQKNAKQVFHLTDE
jgi:TatD DNase family protein